MSLKDRRHNTGNAELEVETKAMPMAGSTPQHLPVEEQLPFPDNPIIPPTPRGKTTPQKDFPSSVNRAPNGLSNRSRTAETPPPDVPIGGVAFPVVPFSGFTAPTNEASTAQPLPGTQSSAPSKRSSSIGSTSLAGFTSLAGLSTRNGDTSSPFAGSPYSGSPSASSPGSVGSPSVGSSPLRGPAGQGNNAPMPGVTRQLSPAESLPGITRQLSPSQDAQDGSRQLVPGATRQLTVNVTRQLNNLPTGNTSYLSRTTNSLREPVVIPSTGLGKPTLPPQPPIKRRLAVHGAVTALVLLVAIVALLIVVPASSDGGSGNIFGQIQKMVNSQGNNSSTVASQAATATAVTQDGYDGGNHTYAGLPVAPAGAGSGLSSFLYGQCTYWAAMRYHQLTGVWVNWRGNADQWANGAASMGWVVSSQPKVGSIIVLQPYVQGAGYYGHVAVVEGINGNGSINTSNWNWGGNWARTSYVTFYPGSGVSFIYAPGH